MVSAVSAELGVLTFPCETSLNIESSGLEIGPPRGAASVVMLGPDRVVGSSIWCCVDMF